MTLGMALGAALAFARLRQRSSLHEAGIGVPAEATAAGGQQPVAALL